jgi:riboflavin kinase/FMN adenylyltransferase
MKLFRGVTNIPPNFTGCVASIGNFDGVHLGHQVIIQKLIEISGVLKQPSVLITFEPQPNEFFSDPETTPPRLMRFREKWLTLQTFSLNYLLCLPFNKSLADFSAESFIEKILVHHLKVKHVLVGDDFQFGKHRSGNINTLQEGGKKFNFTVSHLPTYKIADERVSSSNIRSTLQNGDLEKARILLGKDYGIFGKSRTRQQAWPYDWFSDRQYFSASQNCTITRGLRSKNKNCGDKLRGTFIFLVWRREYRHAPYCGWNKIVVGNTYL